MAEEIKSGQLKLKVDPKKLQDEKYNFQANESRRAVTAKEISGRTVNMKKENEPEVVSPQAVEALPMKALEVQHPDSGAKKKREEADNKKKRLKNAKKVATAAEREYYRAVIISVLLLAGILTVATFATIGFFSYYLLKRVIADPRHGHTLHNGVVQIRNAGSLSEKYEIMMQVYNEVRGADLSADLSKVPKESKYKQVLRQVEEKVNKMHSIDETMPEAPDMKNTLNKPLQRTLQNKIQRPQTPEM